MDNQTRKGSGRRARQSPKPQVTRRAALAGLTLVLIFCGDPSGQNPSPIDVAPHAVFTSSCTGLSCVFTDGSTDPDGTIVSRMWNYGDGSPLSGEASHTYPAEGTYTVTLTVTDNAGGDAAAAQEVTVSAPATTPPPPPPGTNNPPTAAFTSSCSGLSCAFSDESTDPDGSIVGRSWNYGDESPAGAEPSHTYISGATYHVTLTVTDDDGASNSLTQSVTVSPSNVSPTAEFTSSCINLSCTFTDQSSDTDGTIVSRSWNYGDGSPAGTTPSYTYATGGTYTVSLTVTDDAGGTNSVSHEVTVSPPNAAPSASFTSSCAGLTCTFTDGSTDSDGTIASRSWSFGDGSTSTAVNPAHTYAAAGSYTASLAVVDDDGATNSTSRSVTVTSADILFIGAGDIAGCSSDFKDRETAAIIAKYPDATVFALGDNAYDDGTLTQYNQCYGRSWGAFKSRTRPAPGNHEYHSSGAPGYFQYYGAMAGPAGRGYYSYNLGNWHIISLNSEVDASATSAQATWLKQDLTDNPAQCTIAYWHKPLFTSAVQHPNETKMRPLFTILYNAGVEIVMSGHNHHYERFAPQRPDATRDDVKGIREFVVGGGGHHSLYDFTATLQPNSEKRYKGWGVLKLTLKTSSYAWEFLPIAGASFTDAGTGVCH